MDSKCEVKSLRYRAPHQYTRGAGLASGELCDIRRRARCRRSGFAACIVSGPCGARHYRHRRQLAAETGGRGCAAWSGWISPGVRRLDPASRQCHMPPATAAWRRCHWAGAAASEPALKLVPRRHDSTPDHNTDSRLGLTARRSPRGVLSWTRTPAAAHACQHLVRAYPRTSAPGPGPVQSAVCGRAVLQLQCRTTGTMEAAEEAGSVC